MKPSSTSLLLRYSRTLLPAIIVAAVATTTWALMTGTPFEGTDGDLVAQSGIDWQSFVGSPQLNVGHDLPSGQEDDSFSDKEDAPEPEVTLGSIPGNKSDLLRFYVVHDLLESDGLEKDFLYLGWVRANTLGSANMDFEFNQSTTLSSNGVTVLRTPGDLLITFGFSGGGNGATLGLSRWTETGACEAGTAPCWGPIVPLTGSAEGAVNTVPVLDPIAGVTLPELTFGEAVIDLTGAGVFDAVGCRNFGHAYVKSRSSDSFTSSLKDFISPLDITVSNCATVTIRKDAVPNDPQDFTFNAQGGLTPASFQLDDDGSNANALPGSRTWEGSPTGLAMIAEAATAGWDVSGITCSGDAAPVLDGEGNLTGEVTMDLGKGEAVDCTFTNTKRGRILIDEVTVPGGDAQAFAFHLTGGPDDVTQDPLLADASPLHDSGVIRPGTYSIAQDDPGDAWDLTSAVCSDGSAPGAIVLDPGETVTCTFTNTRRGQILVDLEVTPSGDPQPFDFSLTGGPSALNQAFQLEDQDPSHASGYVLPGSGYAAASVATPAGYYFISSSCSDGSPVNGIQLSPAETVTCTFRYVKGGRLTVDKNTNPADDPTSFNFSLTGGPSALNQAASLKHSDAPSVTGWLKPGAGYRITETIASGWDLTQLTCSSSNGTSATSIVGADPAPGLQPGDNAVVVDLGAADDVVCSFTNTKRAQILVDVVVTPSGDPQLFDFTLTGGPSALNQAFQLEDQDAPRASGPVLPGSGYAAAAGATPAGYYFISSSCSDGSPVDGIELSPAETVTCTFNYVKGGRLTVDKNTTPAGDPTPFSFSLTGGPSALNQAASLKHADAPSVTGWLQPGAGYRITETIASGWDLTQLTCSSSNGTSTSSIVGSDPAPGLQPGDNAAVVDLGAGDDVVCAFTNTRRGRILIDEVTVPSGEAQLFSFHLTGGPDSVTQTPVLADASPLHDSGVLRPGTYAIAQDDPGDAWDLTSAVCSDGSAPGAIVLDPAETVTCTFTNTRRGQILVDLVVTPSGDPQPFDFTLTGGPSALNQAFQLKDQDAPRASGLVLPGSGYAASVATPAGYYFTSATCSDGSAPGAIVLDPAETVTCTFRYVKGGRLTVDKNTAPAGDPTSFSFSLTGGPSALNQAASLKHADAPSVTGWLQPGAGYRITETVAAGWDLTQLTCSSSNGTSTTSIVGADPAPGLQQGDNAAVVDLGAGDDVVCTFTNSKRGRIVVVKDAIPDDPQDFFFDISGPSAAESFVLDDDGDPTDSPNTGLQPVSRAFDQLRLGAYVVNQADPGPAWDAVSVACTDSQGHNIGSTSTSPRTASFTLPAGETITCVFTDIKRGKLIVEKFVAHEPVPGAAFNPWTFPFQFSPSWGAPFSLRHLERSESPWLRGGSTVTVTESTPPKWSATSRCVLPDGTIVTGGATARVTLPPGGIVVCTFINELTMHTGSSGYWRNWENHYSGEELQMILLELYGSPFYTSFFQDGQLVGNAVSLFESIYASNTGDRRILQELTSLMMNLAVSTSDDPEVRALQGNDDVCLDCIIDVSGIQGAEEFIDEWNPSITFSSLTVGDVIAVAEAAWSGSIAAGTWSFDALTESEKALLTKIMEAINQGTILTVDVSNYPDSIGCVELAGLPDATEGVYYSAIIEISDPGVPFAEVIGDLPPGLQIDPYTLEISGVPGYVGPSPVTFTFDLKITIASEGLTETREFSITVNPWPRITSLGCADAIVGTPYSYTVEASGANPKTWSIVSGDLPDGLTLDPQTGTIHGIPTGAGMTQATLYDFEIAVVDANGGWASDWMSIFVMQAGSSVCTPPPPAPTETPDLSLYQWGGVTYVYWTSVSYATGYDFVQGDLTTLRATGGDFSQASTGCLGQNLATMPLGVSGNPPPGRAWFFLVRARNCGGVGSFDTGDAPLRDAEIEASGQCQ